MQIMNTYKLHPKCIVFLPLIYYRFSFAYDKAILVNVWKEKSLAVLDVRLEVSVTE